jgi:hypothetical protein
MDKYNVFKEIVDWSSNTQLETSIEALDDKQIEAFKALLRSTDENEKLKLWKEHFISLNDDKQQLLVNPLFLGYGNPSSDLLIVGKEKGFDIQVVDEKDKEKLKNDWLEFQFLKESILNNFYWKENPNGKYFSVTQPYDGIQDDFHSGHTWRLYRKVIAQLNPNTSILDSKNEFFNHCFITEFNHLPSKYSTGKATLHPKRLELFKKPFFKSFSKVLLTYRSYDALKENLGLTEKIYDVEFVERDKIGKQNYLKFKSKDQKRTVILTNQLSGSAGWSDEELNELSRLMN